MKSKIIKLDKHFFVALVFIFLIFFIMVSTGISFFKNDIDEARTIYSSYLNKDYSNTSKAKAALLTVKEFNFSMEHKDSFINVFGLTQKVIGNTYIRDVYKRENDVVKLNNGYITFTQGDNREILEYATDNLTDFGEFLNEKGLDYIHIQAPGKVYKLDKKLPVGISDYSNEFSDELVSNLNKNGIKSFNLADEIIEQGLDHYSMFFKTDHHWTPHAGLWAAREICKLLNSEFDFSIDTDILNPENFSTTVYNDIFLGSQGKRVGKYYAGVEDFPLVLPEFDTDLNNYILRGNGAEQNLTGSFEETLIFKYHLEPIDYFEKTSYSAYTSGDLPLNVVTNNNISDKKIVFIRDSFSCVTTPFLSLAACNELHIFDPRYYNSSIRDYIEKLNPDIVITFYNPRYNWDFYNIK